MPIHNLLRNPPSSSAFDLTETSAKMAISEVFAERNGCYLNEFTLFVAHFNAIPNIISENEIDCKKASLWFSENFKSEIKNFYYNKRNFHGRKYAEIDDMFFFLHEDLIVNFDSNCSGARFLYRTTEFSKVDEIVNKILKFKKRKQKLKPEISLIVNTQRGIETKHLSITTPKLNIEDNYNEDFSEIHHIILKRLTHHNGKGLVLLHGKPGTGKTSYIRYLISRLKKKCNLLAAKHGKCYNKPKSHFHSYGQSKFHICN